jgi:hypothetical protein
MGTSCYEHNDFIKTCSNNILYGGMKLNDIIIIIIIIILLIILKIYMTCRD